MKQEMCDSVEACAVGNVPLEEYEQRCKKRAAWLKELLGGICLYRQAWTTEEDTQKAETVALATENTVSAKGITDSPLKNEEDTPAGDFIQVVSKAHNKRTIGKNTLRRQRSVYSKTRR